MFVEVPSNLDRLQEETAIFKCNATSEPLYSIRWEKGNEPIAEFLSPDDTLDSVSNFRRLNGSIGSNVTKSNKYSLTGNNEIEFGQLTIYNSSLSDEDTYTCFIANVHGQSNASATLTVQGTHVYIPHCIYFEKLFKIVLNCSCSFLSWSCSDRY